MIKAAGNGDAPKLVAFLKSRQFRVRLQVGPGLIPGKNKAASKEETKQTAWSLVSFDSSIDLSLH